VLKMNTLKLTIWEYLKPHWKGVTIGVCTALALVAIVFFLPLVPVAIENMHTEYATEIKQEPYTVTEPYVTSEIWEKSRVIASGFYKVIPSGIEIPFYVDKADSRLVAQFDNTVPGSFNVFDAASHIIYETLGSRGAIDLPLQPGKYRARFRENLLWGEDCYLSLEIKWIEVERVTRDREATGYRWITVQVPRYTTIITEERISVWKHLFG
jgi:hypothetical protein